jgi:hypothetical protein
MAAAIVRAHIVEQPGGAIRVTLLRSDGLSGIVGERTFPGWGNDAVEDRDNRITTARSWALERIQAIADGLYDHSMSIEVRLP